MSIRFFEIFPFRNGDAFSSSSFATVRRTEWLNSRPPPHTKQTIKKVDSVPNTIPLRTSNNAIGRMTRLMRGSSPSQGPRSYGTSASWLRPGTLSWFDWQKRSTDQQINRSTDQQINRSTDQQINRSTGENRSHREHNKLNATSDSLLSLFPPVQITTLWPESRLCDLYS